VCNYAGSWCIFQNRGPPPPPPVRFCVNNYRKPPKKALYAATLLLLAAACLIPLSCSHPVNGALEGGGESGESTVTIQLPGAERSASRSAITGATIARLEFSLTLTKGSAVKTAIAPPGKPTVTVNLAAGEWYAAAEAYLPAGHVHVGTGSATVKVGPGHPNKVIITMVFDKTMPAAVTADYMGQTYTAVYAGNAVYTVALNSYDPAEAVQIQVIKALAEQDISITNNGLATSAYVSEPKQETLARGTGPAFSVGAGSGFTTDYTVNLVYPGGYVISLAGSTYGYLDGPAAAAQFKQPNGVAVDGAGNVYVADSNNNRIRKITPAGDVTTLAGDGTSSFADGPGATARFYVPKSVAVDGAGNVYVADSNNHRIRKIAPGGTVSTFAGDGTSGHIDGPGTGARFYIPEGVAVDGAGNLYVADTYNNRIRKIVIATGVVTTLAGDSTAGDGDGPGTAAHFNHPFGVAADGAGNLYEADYGNHRIRKIVVATKEVTTLAGSSPGFADGPGATAQFHFPAGVAVDGAGNLYVADYGNHRIRKIEIAAGAVTTLTGGSQGYADGALTTAQFNTPSKVAVDDAGNLYVGDSSNNRIRKIFP
jgi:sugar lactone lactonase YvrE